MEVAILSGIYYVLWYLSYDVPTMHNFSGNGKWLLMGIYAFLTLILFKYCDSFKFGHLKLTDVVISQWISIIIINGVTYFQLCLIAKMMLKILPMLILTGIDVFTTFVLSYIYTVIYHHFSVPKRMIMIYGTEGALSLKGKMDTRNDKYKIIKMISCENVPYDKIINEIKKYDAVVINDVDAKIRNDLLKYCYKNSIRTYLVPKLSDIIYSGGEEITLFDTPLKLVKGRGLSPAQRFIKRIFDLILSGIAAIPTLIITLFVAIAIKAEDRGPVFYRQKR